MPGIKIREAICGTCGFETFVTDVDTMGRVHRSYDGAHEASWYVDDALYRHDDIHILSATIVTMADGINRHVTQCCAVYVYGRGRDEYVVGNYAGSRGATCRPCITSYQSRYGC